MTSHRISIASVVEQGAATHVVATALVEGHTKQNKTQFRLEAKRAAVRLCGRGGEGNLWKRYETHIRKHRRNGSLSVFFFSLSSAATTLELFLQGSSVGRGAAASLLVLPGALAVPRRQRASDSRNGARVASMVRLKGRPTGVRVPGSTVQGDKGEDADCAMDLEATAGDGGVRHSNIAGGADRRHQEAVGMKLSWQVTKCADCTDRARQRGTWVMS